MNHLQTPSQTIGPFFAYGLTPEAHAYPGNSPVGHVLVNETSPGERILLRGKVLDGNGSPVNDALLEIRQADANGSNNSDFVGWGRSDTGVREDCSFLFETIKPGANEGHAPCIFVTLFMRGLLSHLFTKIYFSDEKQANESDPFLDQIDSLRRETLIARKLKENGQTIYEFDIHMQGELETVFLDF